MQIKKKVFFTKSLIIFKRCTMLEEYDIEKLNPRKNPYAKKLKQQITIKINKDTIEYFKQEAENTGIPYQTLINLYLSDCMENKRKLKMSWS